MSPDTKALVDAINNLRQSSSVVKNYIWPIVPVVISSIGGFYIASYNFKSQEVIRTELRKIENVNRFLVQIDSAFQSLVSVKLSYAHHITDNPIERVLTIPEITNQFSDVNGVEELVFLAKGCKVKEGDPYYVSWNNIPRINTMVGNYKYLLQRIYARNELRREFEIYAGFDDDNNAILNLQSLNAKAQSLLKKLVCCNESVIALVDGLILEFNSFLCGITKAIEEAIDMKKIRDLTLLVTFNNNNKFILQALQPSPRPNFNQLSRLLGVDIEVAKSMFDTGYY